MRSVVLAGLCMLTGFVDLFGQGTVTFNNQIVRIFQQQCQTCHRPGNIAPFPLLTYADARPRTSQIRHAVESGQMPPWKPASAHGVFEDERGLSAQEIAAIVQWIENGAPEGDPSELPPAMSFPQTWTAGPPDIVLQPAEAFPLDAASGDVYRCFSMPVTSASDIYIRGYEVLPGVPTRLKAHNLNSTPV